MENPGPVPNAFTFSARRSWTIPVLLRERTVRIHWSKKRQQLRSTNSSYLIITPKDLSSKNPRPWMTGGIFPLTCSKVLL
jgi:hypothetical protein